MNNFKAFTCRQYRETAPMPAAQLERNISVWKCQIAKWKQFTTMTKIKESRVMTLGRFGTLFIVYSGFSSWIHAFIQFSPLYQWFSNCVVCTTGGT